MSIPPDSRNWTFVITERCEECGFDGPSLDVTTVDALVLEAVRRFDEVLRRDDVRDRRAPTTWSPLEYACHVRDVFRIYDHRLERMLTEEDPLFENWDQDATAVEDRYREQDPATVARELRDAGTAVAARFESVRGEQWQRPGSRSDGSTFTVDTFARYFIHDPVHHLFDVTGSIHDFGS